MNTRAFFAVGILSVFQASAVLADVQSEAKSDRVAADLARSSSRNATPSALTCTLPSPLPVAPLGGLAAGTFQASWSTTDSFTVTVWREPCSTGSVTYLRVVPTRGVPFVCSSAFLVLQNLTQYDIKLAQTSSGGSFCNDLLAPVTTVIDQYSFDPQFNQAAAFSLVYEGVYANSQGAVLATNGTPFKPWVMLELSTLEEANMRGAVNYYNTNPSAPFLRLVLEERTVARYSSLAAQLGMPLPPPR